MACSGSWPVSYACALSDWGPMLQSSNQWENIVEVKNESTREGAGNWAGTGEYFRLQTLGNSKSNCTSNAAGMP